MTSNNKKNPSYKAFKTVLDEYKDFTMVNNIKECDKIEIKLSSNITFPNATITSRTFYSEKTEKLENHHSNKLNFLHRIDNIHKPGIYFKIYGAYIENVKEEIIESKIIDYKNMAQPICFKNTEKIQLNDNEIFDVIGKIREGIQDGEYTNEYRIIKVRKSEKFTLKDIEVAKQNYNKYLEEIQELPF